VVILLFVKYNQQEAPAACKDSEYHVQSCGSLVKLRHANPLKIFLLKILELNE
jgi:hypothetical protein